MAAGIALGCLALLATAAGEPGIRWWVWLLAWGAAVCVSTLQIMVEGLLWARAQTRLMREAIQEFAREQRAQLPARNHLN